MATTVPRTTTIGTETREPGMKNIDVVSSMLSDHQKVKNLFNQYKSSTSLNTKQDLSRSIIKEIKSHAALEETIVYPEFRKSLPDGNRLADRSLNEHRKVEKQLDDLNNMNLKDDEVAFDTKMNSMMEVLLYSPGTTHVKFRLFMLVCMLHEGSAVSHPRGGRPHHSAHAV